MALSSRAAEFIEQYSVNLSKTYETVNPEKRFSISPVIETKLRQAILESDSFIRMLSILTVDQISGQVVDVGTGGLLTGRVKNGRHRANLGHDGNTYSLVETDSCACIAWETMTQWANSGKPGEFIRLMNNAATRNFALDMLRIGWHGTSIAETTDPKSNPNGEDVNKGWLQIVKEKRPEQVLGSAQLDPTGKTPGSYKNLDALVNDLVNTTIHDVFKEDADLVVLVGRDLVSAEQHRLLSAADTPTEHKAAQSLAKTIDGKKAYIPPFFKRDQIMVTTLKNLQIMVQKGTQWRKARNEEDRKQFENSYLRMEGYGVGNFDKFAAIETVEVLDPNTELDAEV
ncbi:phage major capsid protein, P2 family [Vibrio azureus]|uniref:Putative phage major capsid protein n=1 Tax=Vibrio azureus NBRC 104587 TaxID=1219077 RepID=U3A4T9_9VIBR|nr:phage major capsid protein, P2 family [Vibrio azureus]AUI86597.1 phage major capsid protein, P2 family [Vibrio azureus]GAD75026.1 putative phage major capsid protein [Vibrio azureus NBRC 104587]